MALELEIYNIDIASLFETRLSEFGSIVDTGYTFFWSGKPTGQRRESGDGFAIKNSGMAKLDKVPTAISDRIMSLKVPLVKGHYATLINVYAPTMTNPEEAKQEFYSTLTMTLRSVPQSDKLLLIGVRFQCPHWKGTKHCI